MSRLYLLVTIAALSLAIGCGGPPTLDASSEKAFEASIKAMGETLDEAQKKELMASIMKITLKDAFKDGLPGMMKKAKEQQAKTDEENKLAMFKPFHGKTAQEIIAEGKKIGPPAAKPKG